jgi:hypothetical protein
LALKGAPDAPGQALDERLQLGLARRRNAPEHWRLSADEVRTIEHEHMKVMFRLSAEPDLWISVTAPFAPLADGLRR